MLHFTFQNMRAFYGPWPRGLGLITCMVPGLKIFITCNVSPVEPGTAESIFVNVYGNTDGT